MIKWVAGLCVTLLALAAGAPNGVISTDVTAQAGIKFVHNAGRNGKTKAQREEILFRRFKADETSQNITGQRRLISPEDNNERQPIHEHESGAIR